MIYIKVNPDTKRVTAMAAPGYHCGAGEIAVELTEAMQGSPSDYVLMDGALVYSPEAEAPEVYEPSMEERLTLLGGAFVDLANLFAGGAL